MTLSGKADLPEPQDEARPAIGSVHAGGDTIDFYAFVPAEHMAQLVVCAASGRAREAWLPGTPLKRRGGTISRVSVTTEVEEASDQPDQTAGEPVRSDHG